MKKISVEDLIRFEKSIEELYFSNRLPFLFHLSGGNESQLVRIFENIAEEDYVISNHRNHYHALLKGIPSHELREKIMDGKSMFIYDRNRNFFCSAIIGGTPAIAVGVAWALKRNNSSKRVWCFVGDGTEDSGHLWEAVRYAEGFDLPCTFIIESNNRSVESSNEERWGSAANYTWNSAKVLKYSYEITYPHARVEGKINLSEAKKWLKTHDEYFPLVSDIDFPLPTQKTVDLTYAQAVEDAMNKLGKNGHIFLGYNTLKGDAMGTLVNVPNNQKIETPVAENLMVGLAIGMSFEGFRPVVYFERHDFMLVAFDAIINHLDKIERISLGEFKTPVIVRAVTADGGPFYSGITHSQDFSLLLKQALHMKVFDPKTSAEVVQAFEFAAKSSKPTIVIERKSLY